MNRFIAPLEAPAGIYYSETHSPMDEARLLAKKTQGFIKLYSTSLNPIASTLLQGLASLIMGKCSFIPSPLSDNTIT